jgi:hypothetical protein
MERNAAMQRNNSEVEKARMDTLSLLMTLLDLISRPEHSWAVQLLDVPLA